MSNFYQQLKEIIYEFQYDLISRVLAGFIFLFALSKWSIIFTKAKDFTPDNVVNLTNIDFTKGLVILAMSYFLGLFFSTMSQVLHLVARPFIWILLGRDRRNFIEKKRNELANDTEIKFSLKTMVRFFDFFHNYLKKQNSDAKYLLPKLSAETGLLYNLTIGTIFVLLIAVWLDDLHSQLIPLSLIGLLLFIAGLIRSKRLWFRQVSMIESIKKK